MKTETNQVSQRPQLSHLNRSVEFNMETLIRKSARLVIIDGNDRLLLFQYRDGRQPPFWATAGGELKAGENYREAAARELYEETGLSIEIGELLRDRDEIYAVARSVPARWQEQYFLVKCPANSIVRAANWTAEEKSTIQKWKWWSLSEMREQPASLFKPEWLPSILESASS